MALGFELKPVKGAQRNVGINSHRAALGELAAAINRMGFKLTHYHHPGHAFGFSLPF